MINFDDNANCLLSGEDQMREMNVIQSHHHEVITETVNKVARSANDDKRIILPDGDNTFGSWTLLKVTNKINNNLKELFHMPVIKRGSKTRQSRD